MRMKYIFYHHIKIHLDCIVNIANINFHTQKQHSIIFYLTSLLIILTRIRKAD
jgi:hypothetical protein